MCPAWRTNICRSNSVTYTPVVESVAASCSQWLRAPIISFQKAVRVRRHVSRHLVPLCLAYDAAEMKLHRVDRRRRRREKWHDRKPREDIRYPGVSVVRRPFPGCFSNVISLPFWHKCRCHWGGRRCMTRVEVETKCLGASFIILWPRWVVRHRPNSSVRPSCAGPFYRRQHNFSGWIIHIPLK